VQIGYEAGGLSGLNVCLGFGPTPFNDTFCVDLLCSAGSARLTRHGEEPHKLSWGAGKDSIQTDTFDPSADSAYRMELHSFVDWVQSGTRPVLSWREGWRTVQVIEAAYKSIEEEGLKIPIAPIPPFTS